MDVELLKLLCAVLVASHTAGLVMIMKLNREMGEISSTLRHLTGGSK